MLFSSSSGHLDANLARALRAAQTWIAENSPMCFRATWSTWRGGKRAGRKVSRKLRSAIGGGSERTTEVTSVNECRYASEVSYGGLPSIALASSGDSAQ